MILNVSGRTDIVAFYTPWFLNRLKEGFVDVRNPFYPKKISRIYFQDVDLIVFCTKNPLPILPYLHEINIPILFQVTLTPYKKDIEPNVIEKEKIIEGIKALSKILGKERVSVRYDPILLNQKYTILYHQKAFEKLCSLLEGVVEHIIISFVDSYKNVLKNQNTMQLKTITKEEMKKIGSLFGKISQQHHIQVQLCYEQIDLTEYGISNTPCVSKEQAYEITKKNFSKWKARNCGCVEMVDIGSYNTCLHLCKYCYANYEEKKVYENQKKHESSSSLLIGHIENDDEIKIRKK